MIEMKKRPRSHWAAYQRGLRKAELAYVSELRHEANRRANYRLELANINSLLGKMYHERMSPLPRFEERKAALEAMIKESLGQ